MHDESCPIQDERLPFSPHSRVLDYAQSHRRAHIAFVLVRVESSDDGSMYVVWSVNMQDYRREIAGGFYDGRYFSEDDESATADAATAEFQRRLKEG